MATAAAELERKSRRERISPDATIDLFHGLGRIEVHKGAGDVAGFEVRYRDHGLALIGNEEDRIRLFDNDDNLREDLTIGDTGKKERLSKHVLSKFLRSLGVTRVKTFNGSSRLVRFDRIAGEKQPVSLIEVTRHGKKVTSIVFHCK